MSEIKTYSFEEIINDGIPNEFGVILPYDSLKLLWKNKKSAIEFEQNLFKHFEKIKKNYGLDDSIYMQYFFEIIIQSIDNKKVPKISEESVINSLFIFFNLDFKVQNDFKSSYKEKQEELDDVIIFLKKGIKEKIKELETVKNIAELKNISEQLYLSYLNALNETPNHENDPTWNLYFQHELKQDIAKFKKFNIWIKEYIKDLCKPIDTKLFENIDINKLRLFISKQYLEIIKNNLSDNILILDYINRTITELSKENITIINQYFITNVQDYNITDTHGDSITKIDKYTIYMLKEEFTKLLEEKQELKEQLNILSKFNKNDFNNLNITEVKEYVNLILSDVKDNWQNVEQTTIEQELTDLVELSKNSSNEDKNKIKLLADKLKFLLEHKPIKIIKGEDTFKGYYGFIYPNGKIILESLYEDDNKTKISYGKAIYQMDLKTFKENGKLSKTELLSKNKNIRIIHRGDWKKELEDIITTNSTDDTILDFKSIDFDSIINLDELSLITSKLEQLEEINPSLEIQNEIKKANTRRKKLIIKKIDNDLTENPSQDYSLLSERDKVIKLIDEIDISISKSDFINFFDEYYKKFTSKLKENKTKRNPAIAAYTKKRANNTCDCCGDKYDSSQMFDSHHLIPLSQEGPDNIYNTVCLCPRCHRIAHTTGFTTNQLYILIEKIKQYLINDNLPEYIEKFNQLFSPYKELLEKEKFFMEWNRHNKSK